MRLSAWSVPNDSSKPQTPNQQQTTNNKKPFDKPKSNCYNHTRLHTSNRNKMISEKKEKNLLTRKSKYGIISKVADTAARKTFKSQCLKK